MPYLNLSITAVFCTSFNKTQMIYILLFSRNKYNKRLLLDDLSTETCLNVVLINTYGHPKKKPRMKEERMKNVK